MEKIDLTKCNNCRFRAKVDGKEIEGRISVVGDYLQFSYLYGRNESCHFMLISYYREYGLDYFDDFELVPRDPRTYRDWQVGDVIYNLDDEGNTVSGEDEMCRVIFRSGELVAIAENCSVEDSDARGCYTCSQLFREDWRLVLTDIEEQIIEEKKKYEPQDGDIVAWKEKEDEGRSAISIYRKKNRAYFTLFVDGMTGGLLHNLAMNIVRPATEDEKQMLFDVMAKKGKRWNAEKKVVEDIPKPYEFRTGEPVLVRDYDNELWALYAYHEQAGDKHIVKTCFQTVLQSQCIPYNERTMHLLGTSEDYKEEI